MPVLRHLLPPKILKSLDDNPAFQWFVIGLGVVVGIYSVIKGINGIRDRYIVGKRGREFEGWAAQVVGALYALAGAGLVAFLIWLKLAVR